jgi:CheY-like chemotaxis protein
MLILHLNSNTDDQVLLQAAAKQAGVPMEWHVVDSIERGISYLKSMLSASQAHPVRWLELILLDLPHPTDDTLPFLKFIRETPELKCIPVVVYTGNMNPSALQAARDSGINALHAKPSNFQDTWGTKPACP